MSKNKKTTIKQAIECYRKIKDKEDRAFIMGAMTALLAKSESKST